MTEAIRFVLEQRGFKAGPYTVGYQSCDDATAQAGGYDLYKCFSNAKAYARNLAVLGVVGPHNSGCADVQIPIANQAPGGALAMISPSNTWTGLTRPYPGMRPGELEDRYPSGERNFFRIAAADHLQARGRRPACRGAGRAAPVRSHGRGPLLRYRRGDGGAEPRARGRRLHRSGAPRLGVTSASPDASPGLAPTRSSSAASSFRTGAPWFGISAPASVPTWRSSPPTGSAPSRI